MKTIKLTPRIITLIGVLFGILVAGNVVANDPHDAPAPTAASVTPKAAAAAPAVAPAAEPTDVARSGTHGDSGRLTRGPGTCIRPRVAPVQPLSISLSS